MINTAKNIILIGMMGTWKSTVGRLLAKHLPFSFLDIDEKIEGFYNMSVSDIFSELGEKKFRESEQAYFCEKAIMGGFIISTGGGLIISQKNRNCISNNGFSILLTAAPSIIASRIKKPGKRPLLLNSKNMTETLEKIWQERKAYYYDCADLVINNDNLTSVQTVNEILGKIK